MDDGECQLAKLRDSEAVGDGVWRSDLDSFASRQRERGVVRGGRLYADHVNAGPHMLRGDGAAGHQTSATDGDHDSVEVGHFFQQFECSSSLSCDDPRMVEGWD